jgi:hypothetical protein
METLLVIPKNEKQSNFLKLLFKEMNIKFKIIEDKNSSVPKTEKKKKKKK